VRTGGEVVHGQGRVVHAPARARERRLKKGKKCVIIRC
jgi:hypothetical protein